MSTGAVNPIAIQSVPLGSRGDDQEMMAGRMQNVERAISTWFPYYIDVETNKGMRRLLAIGLPTNDVVRPHPWKVSLSRTNTPPDRTSWSVLGGTVYDGLGGSFVVNDSEVTAGEGQKIYLLIERESSSRAMISAVVQVGTDLPTSDYVYQYIPLAEIVDERAVQYAFEEIRFHELMLVENGEFKLATFQMAARNTYDPPSS